MISIAALRDLGQMLGLGRLIEVVDIGANPINPAPYDHLIEAELARVWGFEPQPDAYEALREQESEFRRYLPYAVGDGKERDLRICHGSGFTSLFEPSLQFQEYVNHFRVKMRVRDRLRIATQRLDDVPQVLNADLIKIDVQGAEVMVFSNAERALSSAVAVICEVGFIALYDEQPLLDEQMRLLRSHGFVLHKFLHSKSVPLRGPLQARIGTESLRNQLVDGDAVFVRPITADTTVSDDALKTLALLSATVFDSLDVCLRCLEVLTAREVLRTEVVEDWVDSIAQSHV